MWGKYCVANNWLARWRLSNLREAKHIFGLEFIGAICMILLGSVMHFAFMVRRMETSGVTGSS